MESQTTTSANGEFMFCFFDGKGSGDAEEGRVDDDSGLAFNLCNLQTTVNVT